MKNYTKGFFDLKLNIEYRTLNIEHSAKTLNTQYTIFNSH